MREAFCIRMNDYTQRVVIGTVEQAREELEKCAKEYYHRAHLEHQYSDATLFTHLGPDPYSRYRRHVLWAIDTVPLTVFP